MKIVVSMILICATMILSKLMASMLNLEPDRALLYMVVGIVCTMYTHFILSK